MFTGIVEQTVRLARAEDRDGLRRIALPQMWEEVRLGESIAINGVCLTVAELGDDEISFDVIKETIERTNLGECRAGDEVNVERSLRAGDPINGHFVQGHVDGVGKLVAKIAGNPEWRMTIEAPAEIAKYLAPKGSICIDGVSLTIAAIDGNRFDVALIPTTLERTTLGRRDIGWQLNLEADFLSKQIVHYLEARGVALQKSK